MRKPEFEPSPAAIDLIQDLKQERTLDSRLINDIFAENIMAAWDDNKDEHIKSAVQMYRMRTHFLKIHRPLVETKILSPEEKQRASRILDKAKVLFDRAGIEYKDADLLSSVVVCDVPNCEPVAAYFRRLEWWEGKQKEGNVFDDKKTEDDSFPF